MNHIECICNYCKSIFLKDSRRHNESIKFGWKPYCSKQCRLFARTTRIQLLCDNPKCNISFERLQKEFIKSDNHYCSRSCAASVNNKKYPKRSAYIKKCIVCNGEFTGEAKCCSLACRRIKLDSFIIPRENIINLIKSFYKINERIPFKNEFPHYSAARERFGTWNNAIITAGFNPNPVKFAYKHVANDGHICDSMSEKIIDDWLYRKQIHHEIHVPYNKNNMSADFKIGDIFIEFIGLNGQHKAYDSQQLRKKRFWKANKLKVIELYPKDLFPTNMLNSILYKFIK